MVISIGNKEAEKIRKIYIDAISNIKEDMGGNQQSQDPFGTSDFNMEEKNIPSNEDTILFRTGKTNLSFEKNDANIDVLISVLTNLKEKKK